MGDVSAKFIADFTDFNKAVDAAEVNLRTLDQGAAKAGASLSRMTEQVLGQTLIKEAALMAEAIERAGGVTVLTSKELQKMGGIAAEAAEKFRALGKEVPADIQKLADVATHTDEGTSAFKSMATALGPLAGAFGVAFSVDKVVEFGAAIIKDATELRNLSLQTGIAVEDLQAMDAVTGDVGISMEQLGNMVSQMAKRVGGGDASAAGALHSFGLTVEELKKQDPVQLFETLMTSIDGVTDSQEKLRVASELFGDKLGAAVVKASHNFGDAVAKARELNTVMSTESVEAAAKAGETWDRFGKNFKAMTLNMAAGWLDAGNAVVEAADKGRSKWDLFFAFLKEGLAGVTGGAAGEFGALGGVLGQGAPGKDISLPPTAGPVGEVSNRQKMYAIMTDSLKALTAEQEHYMSQLFDIGKLTEQNAATFGVSREQMEAFRAKEEQVIQTQATLATQLQALDGIERAFLARANAEQDKLNKLKTDEVEIINRLTVALLTENDAARKVNEERARAASGEVPGADRGLSAATARDAELARINAAEARTGINMDQARLKAWQDFDEAMGNMKTLSQNMVQATGGRNAFNAGQVPFSQLAPNVNVNVTLDGRQLTSAISTNLIQGSGRQYPGR